MARVKVASFSTPGFIADLEDYEIPPEAWTDVKNVRFNPKGAVAFGGEAPVMSPAPFNPLWLRVFPPIDNPLWVYAGLNQVRIFDGNHLNITRTSGEYAALEQERWQGEIFQGVGIFNNTVDVPQYWAQFSAATPLVDLPFWPGNLRCKFLRPFKNFLFAGFLTENGIEKPFRIRWSDPAEPGTIPASWALDDPTKDSGEVDLAETTDYVVDGLGLGTLFIVYKQRTAHAFRYIGRPDIWANYEISQNKGILARDCAVSFAGGHFVAGIDDIYVHTGQKGSETSLVEARLRNWIFNQIDASNYFNCYALNYERRNEIWFCFPESGMQYPTLAVVWNKTRGGIGIRDIPASPYASPGPILAGEGVDIWDTP